MELLKNNKRIFPLIGAIIVFILSFSVLYMGDNIGLSDNGDLYFLFLYFIWVIISDFPITVISGEYCL